MCETLDRCFDAGPRWRTRRPIGVFSRRRRPRSRSSRPTPLKNPMSRVYCNNYCTYDLYQCHASSTRHTCRMYERVVVLNSFNSGVVLLKHTKKRKENIRNQGEKDRRKTLGCLETPLTLIV